MVMRPIPHSKTLCCMCLSTPAREHFSRVPDQTAKCDRCGPIQTLAETLSANVPLARPGRCQAPLRNLPEDRVCSLLNSAAQFRLRKKAAQIRNKVESHGRDEALFQELAAALGYKENKVAFTLIAQRLTLKTLRHNAADT